MPEQSEGNEGMKDEMKHWSGVPLPRLELWPTILSWMLLSMVWKASRIASSTCRRYRCTNVKKGRLQ